MRRGALAKPEALVPGEKLYHTLLDGQRGSVIVTGGVITGSATWRKFVGAKLDLFRQWLESKGGEVRRVE